MMLVRAAPSWSRSSARLHAERRGRPDGGGDRGVGDARSCCWSLGYAAARFATTLFDNLRNAVFERVGQDATRRLAARRVPAPARRCRCASISSGGRARSPRWSSAGPRASTRCCISCCSTSRRRCWSWRWCSASSGRSFGWPLVARDGGDGGGLHLVHADGDRLAQRAARADERPRYRRGRACGRFAAQFRDGEVFRGGGARGAALRGRGRRLCARGDQEREFARVAQRRAGADHQR